MSVWIQLLMAILPSILAWLQSLLSKNQKLTTAQASKFNTVLYKFHQVEDAAVKVGCVAGGVAPTAQETPHQDIWC